MDKEFKLDDVIRTTLQNSSNDIKADKNSFNTLKERVENSDRGIFSIIKGKLSDFKASMKFSTRKAVTSMLCSLLIVFSLCGAFIPSVRVAAVDAIKNFVYIPIKNAIGSYETKDTPANSVKVVTLKITETTLSDEEISDELGFHVRIPQKLINKYDLSEKWLLTGFESTKNTLAAGIYKPSGTSENAKFQLAIMKSKSEEYKRVVESYTSDISTNKKELQIGDTQVYYFESPIFKGLQDLETHSNAPEGFFESFIETPHEVIAEHIIYWQQDGISYSLTDKGNNLQLEDMTAVAEAIISNK